MPDSVMSTLPRTPVPSTLSALQPAPPSKGIELPPAVAGLAPDLEAMSRSLDDWLKVARQTFGLEPLTGR